MIINTRHKYLFLEIPHTGSTAIARELTAFYGGVPILYKHALYNHFEDWMGRESRDYFVFAGVRNPLDNAVSEYFKLKTDHSGQFSDPSCHKANGGWLDRRTIRRFQYIQNTHASFSQYFQHFAKLPVVQPIVSLLPRLDYVIRFENIQDGFSSVLRLLNIEQVRPIPLANRTNKPNSDFMSFFTPEIRQAAIDTLGPMMRLTGYSIPSHWEVKPVRPSTWMLFFAMYGAKAIYWKYASFNRARDLQIAPNEISSL